MKLNLLRVFILPFFVLISGLAMSQSNNCSTATNINLSSGSACVNGTTVGAITDNILYGTCNTVSVNMVWYTYVTNGSNNTFTVTPGTMTNPEIVLYTGSCPQAGSLQTCNTASGSTALNTTWGLTAGTQVWVGIASNNGTQGTFQLCINSTPPAPGPGNTCAQAIPLCSNATFSKPTMTNNSSGQQAGCFLDPPQRDVWLKFTVTTSGTLAWTATPTVSTTEFDWVLWDVTSGCPGTVVCCNYHYGNNAIGTNPIGSSNGFGMQAITGNGACGIQAVNTNANREYCPPAAVTCGRTYAIQISNYNNTNAGFSLAFTNSTCTIGGNASFTVSPPLICGASTTATITDASTGDCAAVWTYGDGTSYTGPTPPAHTYTTPGTYAITEVIGGACPSNHTEYVQLYGPLSATATATNESCAGSCNGTASVTAVTGGNGVYTYAWSNGATTGSISGLCAGTYTVTISNAICSTSITRTVTITGPAGATVSVNSPTTCAGVGVALNASGATTYSWTPSTGLSATTGSTVTANPPGTTTYTVTGTTSGCTSTATSTVTITPAVTVSVNSPSTCAGVGVALNASGATTYSWTPSTGLSATTGATVTANPPATTTYTVTGTTSGCTGTATSTVTINAALTVTVNSATVCAGTSTALTAGGATTYSWTPSTGLSATTGTTVTANPASTTIYTVTGTTSGCNGTGTSTVTVNPLPVVAVNSPTICAGASGTLTATGATTYSWTPSTGLSATTGASVTANPALTTTYTVTGTASGCDGTASSTVTVNPLPIVTVNSATVCAGASATLTAAGATTYSWTPSTGLSATSGVTVTATPAATTTYIVTGTTSGCDGTASSTVTVNPLPVVTVNSSTVCAGASGTLTASGATTYSWTPSTGLSATTGATVTANPASTTTYTVTGTDNGCDGTGTSTVTVNLLPVVTVNSSTVCAGASGTLTASGATTYSWTPSAGLSATTGATVTANPASTTTYTVTGTDNGCDGTGTSTVTVNLLPVVAVNSSTVCAGASGTLTATGATTYSWTPSTGLSATTGASVTANPAATTTYIVTGTASGCDGTASSTVTVNPLPIVTVNSATVCAGASATLTAAGATTYSWTPSTGLSATSGVTVTATPAATTTYIVTGTTSGCDGTASSTVTVNLLPVVTVNSPTICNGGSATLTATGATTYSWTPSAGLSATTGSTVTANPSVTTIYTVTGTTSGCDGSASATVTLGSAPLVTVNSATVCAGTSAAITASGASTYSWTPSTGLSATTGSSITANPAVTTTYTVTETSSGCSGSNTFTVMVNPLPTLTASNGGPFCFGSTVDLHATTTATIFNWQGPDSFLSTLQNPTITNATLSAAGSYTVIVRDANQCQNTATTSVVVNPLPVVIVGSNSPVCENATVLLTSSNQSSAAGNTFTWVGPGTPAFTSTAQNPFIPSATPLINGSYTVAITDINGCQNSNVVPVTVTPKPNAPLVSPREFCLNATASALSATADPGAILNWYGTNPSGSSSATASVPVTSPAGSSTYYVSQTISGCESDKASIPVVVNALPTGTLSPVSAACAPLCSPFTFNPASSFNINSYSWNMGNGTQTSTVNSISHCYPESGDFSVAVTLTDDKGCVNTLSFNNFVHVIDIPVADFVYTPAPISIIEPSAEFYNASIGSGIISTTWTIFQHDTDMIYMTGETQPGFTFPESGSFTVQLTVVSSYGCSNTISKPVVVKEEFAVYIPNAFSPDNDNINEEFRVEGVGIAKIDMTIFNRWGESIFTSGEQEKGWNGKNDSNNKVDKGVYIYSITATSFTGEIKQYTGHVTVVR